MAASGPQENAPLLRSVSGRKMPGGGTAAALACPKLRRSASAREGEGVHSRGVRRQRDRVLLRERLEVGIDVVGQSGEQREVGHRRDQAAGQDDLQPPDAVGEPAEEDEERRADDQRQADEHVGRRARARGSNKRSGRRQLMLLRNSERQPPRNKRIRRGGVRRVAVYKAGGSCVSSTRRFGLRSAFLRRLPVVRR